MFVNNFHTCCFFIFTSEAVNYENRLLKDKKIDSDIEEKKVNNSNNTLQMLEKNIGEEKLLEFRACKEEWGGNVCMYIIV